jgi:hypothetical protein
VRFSRDKRGYEHVYLVQESTQRGRPSAPRVLYWFRTPPGVKVGREPFDEATRRALEAQNPGLVFDWKKIANTPMPPPDTEPWRERRRAERAARQTRVAETGAPIVEAPAEGSDEPNVADAGEPSVSEGQGAAELGEVKAAAIVMEGAAPSIRRRRRRRGGRGRKRSGEAATTETAGPPSKAAEEDSGE